MTLSGFVHYLIADQGVGILCTIIVAVAVSWWFANATQGD